MWVPGMRVGGWGTNRVTIESRRISGSKGEGSERGGRDSEMNKNLTYKT